MLVSTPNTQINKMQFLMGKKELRMRIMAKIATLRLFSLYKMIRSHFIATQSQ